MPSTPICISCSWTSSRNSRISLPSKDLDLGAQICFKKFHQGQKFAWAKHTDTFDDSIILLIYFPFYLIYFKNKILKILAIQIVQS